MTVASPTSRLPEVQLADRRESLRGGMKDSKVQEDDETISTDDDEQSFAMLSISTSTAQQNSDAAALSFRQVQAFYFSLRQSQTKEAAQKKRKNKSRQTAVSFREQEQLCDVMECDMENDAPIQISNPQHQALDHNQVPWDDEEIGEEPPWWEVDDSNEFEGKDLVECICNMMREVMHQHHQEEKQQQTIRKECVDISAPANATVSLSIISESTVDTEPVSDTEASSYYMSASDVETASECDTDQEERQQQTMNELVDGPDMPTTNAGSLTISDTTLDAQAVSDAESSSSSSSCHMSASDVETAMSECETRFVADTDDESSSIATGTSTLVENDSTSLLSSTAAGGDDGVVTVSSSTPTLQDAVSYLSAMTATRGTDNTYKSSKSDADSSVSDLSDLEGIGSLVDCGSIVEKTASKRPLKSKADKTRKSSSRTGKSSKHKEKDSRERKKKERKSKSKSGKSRKRRAKDSPDAKDAQDTKRNGKESSESTLDTEPASDTEASSFHMRASDVETASECDTDNVSLVSTLIGDSPSLLSSIVGDDDSVVTESSRPTLHDAMSYLATMTATRGTDNTYKSSKSDADSSVSDLSDLEGLSSLVDGVSNVEKSASKGSSESKSDKTRNSRRSRGAGKSSKREEKASRERKEKERKSKSKSSKGKKRSKDPKAAKETKRGREESSRRKSQREPTKKDSKREKSRKETCPSSIDEPASSRDKVLALTRSRSAHNDSSHSQCGGRGRRQTLATSVAAPELASKRAVPTKTTRPMQRSQSTDCAPARVTTRPPRKNIRRAKSHDLIGCESSKVFEPMEILYSAPRSSASASAAQLATIQRFRKSVLSQPPSPSPRKPLAASSSRSASYVWFQLQPMRECYPPSMPEVLF